MAEQKKNADRSARPPFDRALRPLLVLNTLLMVFVLAFGCFLQSYGFFSGQTKLPEMLRMNCMTKEKALAVEYLRVNYRMQKSAGEAKTGSAALNARNAEFKTHFSQEHTNFIFVFESSAQEEKASYRVLSNLPNGAQRDLPFADTIDGAQVFGTQAVLNDPTLQKLTLRYGALPTNPGSPHDGFYKADRMESLAARPKGTLYTFGMLLCVFLILSMFEGLLLVRLFTRTADRLDPRSLQELHNAPMYVLLAFYLLLCANILFLQSKLWHSVHGYFMLYSDDVRPAIVFTLLLALLIWATSLLATTIVARLSSPQWWKRSVIYRAVNLPSVEQRMRMWLTIAVTLEAAFFLILFLEDAADHLETILLADVLITLLILLAAYVQAKGTVGIFTAAHRIAVEKHGFIPTKGLRGQSLRHVRNINFLSRSAGEQMQRRYINENFSTKLINSVSEGLRDPLTAVTKAVEQLRSGSLNEEQTRQRIEQVNVYSQQLKRFIEDLLRIANASAGSTPVDPVPTDVGMMIEQTLGEYCDRFSERNIELVQSVPKESVSILADGACMWTVFTGVLDEFLLYAVQGTRVFLSAEQKSGTVLLQFRGTARTDQNAQTDVYLPNGGLNLPTAKVFTELQNGSFRYQYEQDVLTIRLQFPLCEASAAENAEE